MKKKKEQEPIIIPRYKMESMTVYYPVGIAYPIIYEPLHSNYTTDNKKLVQELVDYCNQHELEFYKACDLLTLIRKTI